MQIDQPTITACLDKRRVKKNKLYPVKIRVTHNGIQRYYPTGIDLSAQDFEKLLTHKHRQALNSTRTALDQQLSHFRDIISKMSYFSFTQLDLLLRKQTFSATNIFPVFDEIIKQLQNENRIKSAKTYGNARNSIRGFNSNLGFYDITPELLKQYELYMVNRGCSLTTVGFNLRALRAVFNYALNKGIITDRSTYPFHITKYTIPAGRNIKKALSAEEIRLIRATTNFSSPMAHWARDMWLLSYFCNGLNMSDLFRLKKDQYEDEYITLFRKKTSTTAANALPVIIYVLPEAAAIIKQWSTESDPYLITGLTDNMTEVEKVKAVDQFIHLINKYMKRLAAQLDIKKKCTCYVARHSYAQALKNAGASIEVISEALGHTSIHTTRHYLNSFKKEVIKKANESLL